MKAPHLCFAALSISLLFVLPALAADVADLEFFEKKIRPILAERCYECHAADHKIKAGLRLDHTAGWLQGGDSGPAVMPGNVDASPLIKAIRYSGLEFEAMPPKSALPKEEIALLEEWVKRGAPAPAAQAGSGGGRQIGLSIEEGRKFWAFIPPTEPKVPDAGAGWARTEIDRFVAAQWAEKGLAPAADADRATLLRRLTFDLTGLPPTPEAIDAFVQDARPDATVRVVDGLLASPQFGERWGRRWLDVARFAESSGGGRTLLFKDAWRYRDYVIDSLNRDVPFDRFIREQLAGDLLPAADAAERSRQVIATGFLALGPTNYEEQAKDALRMDIVDEQLDTLGKAFLGMTIACARCHDHKFDPIPTQDYYALAGILRSTHTLHNYTDNVAKWVDVNLPMEPGAEAEIAAHEARIASLERQIAALRTAPKPAATAKGVEAGRLPGIVIDDPKARVVGSWKSSAAVGGYVGEGYLTDENEGKGRKTVTYTPQIPQAGRYEVRLAYTPGANRATNVPVTVFHADGENIVTVNQREAPRVAGRFITLGTYRFEKDGAGYVLVSTEGTDGFVVADALQLLPLDAKAPGVEVAAAADDPAAKQNAAALRKFETELRQLRASAPARPLAMSVKEAVGEIGDTEIRVRGNARNLGAKVPRGFLQAAMTGPAPEFSADQSGRRELAEWIASDANPLTARVTVNRTWAWLMGAGIVRTVDNFGVTGERPSHPALLDHLARRFVAEGWSMKKLVRAIVLSRVYQLDSIATPEARQLDPDNRLLARANRRRLEAEEIRDAMLAVSGQLDRTVGGPNIVLGPGSAAQGYEYGYEFKDVRRSVYTPAFRNRRLELFEAFDFADINAPYGVRPVTTVAPQALYLMNHPFVTTQAERAAEQTLRAVKGDDAARLEHAYRIALGRKPTAGERRIALDFVAVHAPSDAAEPARQAAWAQVHQALLACVDFRYLR
jgi:cytochrome c553